MAGTEKNEAEGDSMEEDGRRRGNEGRSERRRGKNLAGQEASELGAASMRERRRRRGGGNYIQRLVHIEIIFPPASCPRTPVWKNPKSLL